AAITAGNLVFSPALNGNGANYANFSFSVQDSAGAFDTVPNSVTINVTAVNDAPVAVADTAPTLVTESGVNPGNTAFAGTPSTTGNVLSNDTDVDTGDTKTVNSVNGLTTNVGTPINGTYGSISIAADGTYTYTLNNSLATTQALAQGQAVTEVFNYTLKDTANAVSNSTTLTINISGTNDAPVAVVDNASVVEAGVNPGNTAFAGTATASGNVLTNDTDVDTGDTKAVSAVNGLAANVGAASVAGTYGSITIAANGVYTYTLNNSLAATQALDQGQVVTDVFNYTVIDANGATSSVNINVSVTGTNDAPIAVTDTYSMAEDSAAITLTPLTGDTDPDGTTPSILSINGTTLTPGTAQTIAVPNGVVNVSSAGIISFTPALNFNGTVSFPYVITDGSATATANQTITVTAVNDAPIAIGSSNTGLEDAVSIPVVVQGTDVDGTIASFSLSSLPTNGALYLDAAMTILVVTGTDIAATGNSLTLYFKPQADFNTQVGLPPATQTDVPLSFNFTAKDNNGAVSNVATETITITPVNDGPPVAVNDAFQALVGQTITFTRAQLMANDTLLDNAAITATGTLPTGLTYNAATQTYTYAPTAVGTGSFTYTLTDQDGQTSAATVNLQAFNSRDDLATVYESALPNGTGGGSTVATGNLFANDAGLSGNITNVAGVTTVVGGNITVTNTYGTLVVNVSSGAYTYTLNANVDNDSAAGANDLNLLQTFNYVRGASGNANLQITIMDDVPVAQNNIVEIPQVGTLTNYNLVLMLDVSGSMIAANAGGEVRIVDVNGNVTITTRLAAAKLAMIDMVNKYFDESSSVTVKVGYFSATATAGTELLTTKAAAIAAINAIPATGGGTNYEDGLYKIQDMFGTVDSAKQNVAYFISDGVPTAQVGTGNGINAPATETNGTTNPVSYAQFLANNPSVNSYAIGIGGGISNTVPLDSIHNIDADASNLKDPAILVNDLNGLSAALTATVPQAFGGNVGTGGSNPFVKIGADGGFVQYIDLLLDSNDAGTVPDTIVRFTFNGTNQVSYDNFYLTGTHTTVNIAGNAVTFNAALGFTKGTLVFNFSTGDYSYYTQGAAVSGDQFDIGFSIKDNDGDIASAIETIKIINGKPVANDDRDTLLPKNTFLDGNVISAISTDGASQSVSVFSVGAGTDNALDNAKITSIFFNGATFNLNTPSSGTLGGGTYTINAAKELTWTKTGDPTNTLVFHSDGYYKYTPPASQTAAPAQGAQQIVSFNNAPVAATGVTLQGVTRTGNVNAPNGTIDYSSTGVGVTGGLANNRVDNLETLIINFNSTTHPQGVQNVSLNINTGSNLAAGSAIAVSVYDILGNLLGQVAITTENVVALPSNWSNIGSIRIEPNSNAQVMIDDVRFNSVLLNTTASNIPDTVIGYTLTDDQGDTSSANLILHIVTNVIQGSATDNTITGTNANDAIEGFAGNDIINGGAGSDIIKGGVGDDTINGGADDDQLYGGDGNDTIYGGTGNDLILGDVGDDQLYGDDGNDKIYGGAGNDIIDGGNGNDVISGGAGNDILAGGAGTDVFKWELADKGIKGAPASDTVTDFNVAPVASGGDALDLRDLLTGENHAVGVGNLASYLHFEKVGSDTIIHVSSNGEYAAGFNAAKDVQTITLTNVDLVTGFANDQAVIQDLLTNNKLIVD
ncbi:MAG: Ig-like domain-containing protein, partial [Methylotenera sp.]|nr:Ig-like domain-containing protein [Methylotenera sp.]